MITYKTGDIFESKAQVLVNPVNTVGVMGKGLALEFKKRYPRMFNAYCILCRRGLLFIGQPWLWHDYLESYVLLFPTKRHWRGASLESHIDIGLRYFADKVLNDEYEKPIESIAFPALGCGLGSLNFETQVRPLMEQSLSDLPIDVEVYTSKE